MIDISNALERIDQSVSRLAKVDVPLVESVGYTLAEDIVSPMDSPPFDKSMMDGYAICCEDIQNGRRELNVIDRVQAGAVSEATLVPGSAIQIMTGAPIPRGATAVVMIENTEEVETSAGTVVKIDEENCRQDQNILRRAATMSTGEQIMKAGDRVQAKDIGDLAEIGKSDLSVVRIPSVSILATGDELIPANEEPRDGQIRNSNGPMLEVLCQQQGLASDNLGIAKDERDDIHSKISQGLNHDLLILSGGVSAGVADLVPAALKELGVEEVFHKVSLKPGKPIWYGVRKHQSHTTHIFGLPGNPVSSLVCFQLFVRAAIGKMAGRAIDDRIVSSVLTHSHSQRGGRTTFWPSRFQYAEREASVTPLNWKGSADLKTLAAANSFAIFPGEQNQFGEGTRVDVLLM